MTTILYYAVFMPLAALTIFFVMLTIFFAVLSYGASRLSGFEEERRESCDDGNESV